MSPGAAIALVAGAYLLGSVSFSVVLVKLVQGWTSAPSGAATPAPPTCMRAAGKKGARRSWLCST